MTAWLSQCSIRVTRNHGVLDGPYEFYESGGQIQYRGTFKADKLDGLWTAWDSSGTIIAEIHYQDGFRHGPLRLWYGSSFEGGRSAGQLKLETHSLRGRYHGEYRTFSSRGELRTEAVFKNGVVISARLHDSRTRAAPSEGLEAIQQVRLDESRDLELFALIDESVQLSLVHSQRIE